MFCYCPISTIAAKTKFYNYVSPGSILTTTQYLDQPGPSDGKIAIFDIVEKCTGPNKYHFRDILWKMIQLGADVNYVNKQTGDTIFHYAVETDDSEVIATVCQIQHVDKKKLINFVNFQGYSPLALAILRRNSDSIKICNFLIKNGAKWFNDQKSLKMKEKSNNFPPFHLAINKNALNIIESCCKNQIVNYKIKDPMFGGTPLHWCKTKHMAKFLINNCGLSPNDQSDSTSDTPLHIAIKFQRNELAEYLVLENTNLDLINQDQLTPLETAIQMDNLKMIKILLLFGANHKINARTEKNIAVLARKNNGPNRVRILRALLEVGVIQEADTMNLVYLPKESLKKMRRSGTFSRNSTFRGSSRRESEEIGANEKFFKKQVTFTSSLDDAFITPKRPVDKAPRKRSILKTEIPKLVENFDQKTENTGLRVLCLDGGGIRGIILTKILVELQEEAKRPAHELFDVIAGTSTGALLACSLALKRSPAYCQTVYFRFKDEVLKGSRPYSSEILEHFLQKEFGQRKMSEISPDHKLILTSALSDREPMDLYLFRSYDALFTPNEWNEFTSQDPRNFDTCQDNSTFEKLPINTETLIWEACRASSAAPYFFEPKGRFLDGGLLANNPTIDVLTELGRYNQSLEDNGHEKIQKIDVVCSIGTGKWPTSRVTNNINTAIKPTGITSAIETINSTKQILNMMSDALTATDNYIVDRSEAWCNMIGAKFFRLNSPMTEGLRLDTIDNDKLLKVMWECEVWIHQNRELLRDLARSLVRD